MELKLEVNEEKFREILEKELNAFTEEELHEICRKALIQQMSDPAFFQTLFIDKSERWGYEKYYANDILKEAAKTVNFDETYKEVQDTIINYIREHHLDVIHQVVKEMFINGLTYSIVNNEEFRNRLSLEIYNTTSKSND